MIWASQQGHDKTYINGWFSHCSKIRRSFNLLSHIFKVSCSTKLESEHFHFLQILFFFLFILVLVSYNICLSISFLIFFPLVKSRLLSFKECNCSNWYAFGKHSSKKIRVLLLVSCQHDTFASLLIQVSIRWQF